MATPSAQAGLERIQPEDLLKDAPKNGKQIKNPTPEQLEQAFKQVENEITGLINKLSEMDGEKKEHDLVLAAMAKVPPSRRCCRMVGGVVAERTVGQTIPAVRDNRDRIMTVVDKLNEALKGKIELRKRFQDQYGLDTAKAAGVQPGVKTQAAPLQATAGGSGEGGSAGVLV